MQTFNLLFHLQGADPCKWNNEGITHTHGHGTAKQFIWSGFKYPQIKTESLHLKHILSCFISKWWKLCQYPNIYGPNCICWSSWDWATECCLRSRTLQSTVFNLDAFSSADYQPRYYWIRLWSLCLSYTFIQNIFLIFSYCPLDVTQCHRYCSSHFFKSNMI